MNETEDLLSSSDILRVVVEGALAAVVVMGADGVVRGWGSRAERTFGWSRSEAIGTELAQLVVPPELRGRHRRGLRAYLAGKGAGLVGQVVEMEAVRRSGERFPVEISINPPVQQGAQTLFIAFVMDITTRKRSEDTQRRLLDEVRQANDALRDYANLMVHQLRGPLTVIHGYAATLGDGPQVEPRARIAVDEILRQSRIANELVDGLMQAARVDSSAIAPRPQAVRLEALVEAAVERVGPRAELLEGTLTARSAPGGGTLAWADPDWTAEILDNLLSNALIHSGRRPRVTVRTRARPRPTVVVCDHGPGIPKELRDRIFERFFRAPDSLEAPGNGLGLYLSRTMAERQGGGLLLAVEPGHPGACFRLELPAVP